MKSREQLKLCVGLNLGLPNVSESAPWGFVPDPATLERLRTEPKQKRRNSTLDKQLNWNVYSVCVGRCPGLMISSDNPPASIRGFAADYDARQPVESVLALLEQKPRQFRPQWLEVSLGLKCRLVWLFEEELLCCDSSHAEALLRAFSQVVGAPNLLAGFDPCSLKPAQRWTNGGEWYQLSDVPAAVPAEVVQGVAVQVGTRTGTYDKGEIPLDIVGAEVEKRWPGRWAGNFELNATGVRFWDPTADNTTGCQVKPDGMLCFTGLVPFKRWIDLFGAEWVRDQTVRRQAEVAEGIYYDGRDWWVLHGTRWDRFSDQAIQLLLRTRGVAAQKRKGEMASDMDRLLAFLLTERRVKGAGPMVNHPPGICWVNGHQILNTTTIRFLTPAVGPVATDQFPWIHSFLNGLFVQAGEERPADYFLAWLQRAYRAALDHEPRMGQAVFISGPAHNGKTLLVNHIIAGLLGGGHPNPYAWMVGDSEFNAELFDSYVWAIHDEEAPKNEGARKKFLQRLKGIVVNKSFSYHPKFCQKLELEWVGRFIMTLNDDPASATALPEVIESIRDKLMFFATQQVHAQWPENKVIEELIASELPLFARWLLDWIPPSEVIEQSRTVVKSYLDEHLLRLSRQQTVHSYLAEVLDLWVTSSTAGDRDSWTGSHAALHRDLLCCESVQALVKDISEYKLRLSLQKLAMQKGSGVSFHNAKASKYRIDIAAIRSRLESESLEDRVASASVREG